MRQLVEIIELPITKDMPFNRMEAYVHSWANSKGYNGKYGWATREGIARLYIYDEKKTNETENQLY